MITKFLSKLKSILFKSDTSTEIPLPKKDKPVAKAQPKSSTKSVEDFNDIDTALDNLEFDDA